MPKYSGNDYELRIGRAKMEEMGEYIVKAVNSFGSKEESAVLSVERTFFCAFTILTGISVA
jgi:Immunoglobulin I-set domain